MTIMVFNSTANASADALNTHPWLYVAEPHFVKIIRLVFVGSLATLGFLGNVWVIVQLCKQRSPLTCFICNLAVADLGILTFSLPIGVIKEQMPTNWPLGEFGCQYIYPITEVFHGASVWSIAAIAAERYRGITQIRRSNKNPLYGKGTYVKYFLAGIWLSSFTFTSLPLFFIVKFVKIDHGKYCYFSWPHPTQVVYAGILSLLWYLIPLSVVLFTYIYISKLLRTSTTFHRQSLKSLKNAPAKFREGTTESRRLKENKRALNLLTPMVLVFAITMLPLNVLRIVLSVKPHLTQWKYFLIIYNLSVVAIVINSAADPLIYFIVTSSANTCRCFKQWVCLRVGSTKSRSLRRGQDSMEMIGLQER